MQFLNDRFLLESDLAYKLYDNYSKDLPIYDYHCHLSAQDIYEDNKFDNLYDIWLRHDHYKWRLMRFSGVNERYITGDASPYEKFGAYVKAIEYAIDNPLYHWSHLELRRCFTVEDILTEDNIRTIWDNANLAIKDRKYSPKKAILDFKVDTIITTDEVYSDLKYHKLLAEDDSFKTRVLPSFRADKVVSLDPITLYNLQEAAGKTIANIDDLLECLSIQIKSFDQCGARLADLGLEGLIYSPCDKKRANDILSKVLSGDSLTDMERYGFETFMTRHLLEEYYRIGWSVLIHIGARRNNNTVLFNSLGADIGCDSISEKPYLDGLIRILDEINTKGMLGKTVFFNLNPKDNYLLTTNIGSFASDKSQMQLGISWWFSDSKVGINRMMQEYASLSNMGKFLGMLTDSRSFISYTRHEYFRRILCNYIANLVQAGEYPNDERLLKGLIANISYHNAKDFFG